MSQLWMTDAGGTPRLMTQVHVNDGGVDRALKELWITDAGGTPRKVFSSSGVVSAINTNVVRDFVGGGAASMTITVRRDGTWSVSNYSSGGPVNGSWCTPNGASAGDPFWARMDLVSGDDFSTGTRGAWLQVNTDRAWVMTCPPATNLDGFFTLKFSADAGATVLATGNIEFTMSND